MNVVQQFYQLLQSELQTLRALPSAQGDPRASSTASAPRRRPVTSSAASAVCPWSTERKPARAASTSGVAAAIAAPAAKSATPPRTANLTSTTRAGYR